MFAFTSCYSVFSYFFMHFPLFFPLSVSSSLLLVKDAAYSRT